MILSPAQLETLKTAIVAETNPEFVNYRTNGQSGLMRDWYNQPTNPAFVVYKTSEAITQIGKVINYTAVEAMTDINRAKLTTFVTLNPQTFDPRRTDIHAYFTSTFSGALGGAGQATREAMENLYRRAATRGEFLFATGTGTTATPGALVFEGEITEDDIARALSRLG